MSSRRIFLQGALAAGAAALARPGALKAAEMMRRRDIPYVPIDEIPNHRQWMRDVVVALSDYCKKRRPDLTVLATNAPELLIKERREADWEAGRDPDGAAKGRYSPVGSVDAAYLNAIDGMLFDGAFYGHDSYEAATRGEDQTDLLACAQVMRQQGRHLLSIDYCKEPKHRADALAQAHKARMLPYVSDEGDKLLSHIPTAAPAGENPNHVTRLADARNYLPVMTSTGFSQRDRWIDALAATNHDMLLIDPFWRGASMTVQDVKALKFKRIGSQRLVMAPLTVGFAAIDRFYWQKGWRVGNPDWVASVDPDVTGRFAVSYWTDGWKAILGNYITGLCDLGIDGVVLNGLESYRIFEAMLPI